MELIFDPVDMLKTELDQLKTSVAVCQQQVVELENADGEISTRQVEVNNVSSSLGQQSHQTNNCSTNAGSTVSVLQKHLESLSLQLQQWHQYMVDGREKTYCQILETRNMALILYKKLIGEILLGWKRQQKLGQVGADISNLSAELDAMEPLFDTLLTELVKFKCAVDGFCRHLCRLPVGGVYDSRIPEIEKIGIEVNDQITNLLWECCIIAVQPSTILMLTRTPATDHQRKGGRPPCQPVLRFLGGTRLGIRSQPIGVQCFLISEEEAPKLLQRDTSAMEEIIRSRQARSQKKDSLPLLMNNEATMMEQSDRFFATFPRIHVTKRGGTGQTADSSADRVRVPKKKYFFVFTIELTGAGISKPLRLWRLSLPVGVFSHPKQVWEQGGDASLFWNLAFSTGDGVLTEPEPNGVPVDEFMARLNEKFLMHTGATRALSLEQQQHLKNRITKNGTIQKNLTWDWFYARKLATDDNGDFTFREWFYEAMTMIKNRKNLLEQWNAGLVLGFAGRIAAEQVLKEQPEKTLAIKFSDTKRDLILSYGWKGCPEVSHVLPVPPSAQQIDAGFSFKQMSIDQVVRTTKDLQDIRYIYGQRDNGNGRIKPTEWLYSAVEQDSKQKLSREKPPSPVNDNDPYKRLQLGMGVVGSPQSQAQMQFLIGPTPSQSGLDNIELDPKLIELLNDPQWTESPESSIGVSAVNSPTDSVYDFSGQDSMMSL